MTNNNEYDFKNWEEYKVALDTGINMYYYRCGSKSGTPLILIHGVTDGRISWMQEAPLLAKKGYNCYIVEYRGNGKTDKPDLIATGYTADILADDILNLMDKISLPAVHMIGHSFGSLICQELARKASERCLSLTLIDTTVKCSGNPVLTEVLDGNGSDFRGVYGYEDAIPEDFLNSWATVTNEDREFQMATLEHVKSLPLVAWQNLMTGLIQFDSREYVSKIKNTILVIWGTEDNIFTMEDQKLVKKYLKGCKTKYVDVEGASHNGYWDSISMAEKYSKIIDEFIKSI